MHPYSVLLLTPDYLADTFGHDTRLYHVTAVCGAEAASIARMIPAVVHDTDPDDWHVVLVCAGHITPVVLDGQVM